MLTLLCENYAEAKVVTLERYRSERAIDQLKVDKPQCPSTHIQTIKGRARRLQDKPVISNGTRNLLNYGVNPEIRNGVVASKSTRCEVQISGVKQVQITDIR